MKIDLNDPDALTIESVRKLIASKDDTESRQIRVSEDGILYLSDDVGNQKLDGVKFRLETFDWGNDYVGASAAQDDGWVRRVFVAVRDNWNQGTRGYIDYF